MVQPGNNGIPADLNVSPSQVYTLMLLYSHTNCTQRPQLGLLWQLARSTGRTADCHTVTLSTTNRTALEMKPGLCGQQLELGHCSTFGYKALKCSRVTWQVFANSITLSFLTFHFYGSCFILLLFFSSNQQVRSSLLQYYGDSGTSFFRTCDKTRFSPAELPDRTHTRKQMFLARNTLRLLHFLVRLNCLPFLVASIRGISFLRGSNNLFIQAGLYWRHNLQFVISLIPFSK